jgi:translation elongation factor EF-Tu-like GTPase
MSERTIGQVTHYYGRIAAAALSLTDTLRVGDRIRIVGHTTDETVTVDRMEVDHRGVEVANAGDDVAVHITPKVREHDEVRKVE